MEILSSIPSLRAIGETSTQLVASYTSSFRLICVPFTLSYKVDGMMIGVRSCYDEGKRVAETLMFDYHRQHGIGQFYFPRFIKILSRLLFLTLFSVEIRIARIFNTYGPRMNIDDGRVVSNFIAQALRWALFLNSSSYNSEFDYSSIWSCWILLYRGEALTVQKPGTQTRSFCYVSDMVEGLMRLMEGDETGPINIGNPG